MEYRPEAPVREGGPAGRRGKPAYAGFRGAGARGDIPSKAGDMDSPDSGDARLYSL